MTKKSDVIKEYASKHGIPLVNVPLVINVDPESLHGMVIVEPEKEPVEVNKSEPHYVSPIFISKEKPFTCTINVYQDIMDEGGFGNAYIKSRHSDDAIARLEPNKVWGKLIYRIRVKPHGNQG